MMMSEKVETSPTATAYKYNPLRDSQPPQSMTMNRFEELDELVLAQSTQLCCRTGCCRPSINWVLNDSSNYTPGQSPFTLPNIGGWIHEESTFFMRCCLGDIPGCRETKFVQHTGSPPDSLQNEDWHCCVIQTQPTSGFLQPEELHQDIIATHEKDVTMPAGCCCCGTQPYLTTKDSTGQVIGSTTYVCDECVFVPKFHIKDKYGETKYLLRPDTCVGGLCVLPRCGGRKGKCCRVPFLVRDPTTLEPVQANVEEEIAQVTFLWSGLVNEACLNRHAYHIAFPSQSSPQNCTIEDRLTLIGSSLLVDVALYEHEDDNNGGN